MTIRSLMIGDIRHYVSPYMIGVADAMRRLGHAHAEVSIRSSAAEIERAIAETKPAIIWTHMLLWAPHGSPSREQLIEIVELAARRGARVVLHDADCKTPTRHPHDISSWCALALVNHAHDRSAWKVPTLRWPYFAQAQDRIAAPVPAWRCGLFFAGQLSSEPLYSARTRLVEAIRASGVDLRLPRPEDGNTLLRTPEIAASADAVLGFGRPEATGWVDTRVFQYPGAGGILLHDDVQGYLEPWVHFVPYVTGHPESAVDALARLSRWSDSEKRALRERAFRFVQEHHSSVPRVRQVLETLGFPP